MSKTVVGTFDTFEHARDVVAALEDMGVKHGDVNLVANDAAGRLAAGRGGPRGSTVAATGALGATRGRDADASAAVSAGRGAMAGGAIGGAAGLIAGLAGLAIPGVGPLVAAGPIVVALSGAGIGAVAGGLIGGLREVGVPDTDAEHYAEAVRRGGALVIVRADDDRADGIADSMRRHGAVDIESRVASWRAAGWSGHDATARPLTAGEIERERLAHPAGGGVAEALRRTEDADLRSGAMGGTPVTPGTTVGGDLGATHRAGTTVGTGLGGTIRTTGVPGTEHPDLGLGSDRPGVDVRGHEHARNDRAGDATGRGLPGSADGDGR